MWNLNFKRLKLDNHQGKYRIYDKNGKQLNFIWEIYTTNLDGDVWHAIEVNNDGNKVIETYDGEFSGFLRRIVDDVRVESDDPEEDLDNICYLWKKMEDD